MTQTINQPIDINAFYFVGKDIKTFPRQIEYGGRAITFGSGLRLRVERAGRSIFLFHMSALDGATYRLRQDGSDWTLEGVL